MNVGERWNVEVWMVPEVEEFRGEFEILSPIEMGRLLAAAMNVALALAVVPRDPLVRMPVLVVMVEAFLVVAMVYTMRRAQPRTTTSMPSNYRQPVYTTFTDSTHDPRAEGDDGSCEVVAFGQAVSVSKAERA